MHVYVPWGLFAAAIAAAMLYLQLLPEVRHSARLGFRPKIEGRLLWPCLISLASLFAWPFVAAASIQWEDRAPSVFAVLLMSGGAFAFAFVIQLAVNVVIASAGQAATDEAAFDDYRLLNAIAAGITIGLIGFTAMAWLAVLEVGQQALCGARYRC